MHRQLDGLGEIDTAAGHRGGAMPGFIFRHLLDDGAAFGVPRWKAFEMPAQVLHHLPFGLRHETQAPLVTGQAGKHADGEGAQVPDGIQVAGAPAKFIEPLPAPGQVVDLLCR